MKKKELKLFSVFDVPVFLLTVLLSVALIVHGSGAGKGDRLVLTDENGTKTFPLSVDSTFTVESRGITLSVGIENGEVFVYACDCPDGVCRQTGRISRGGQVIVCAPAGVALRIVSGTEVEHDAVTH